MILDRMENLRRYAGLNPHLAAAVRYFEAHDYRALPDGKTVIDGENAFVNTAVNRLDRAEMAWEAHGVYADVQIILEGRERFGWSDTADMDPLDEKRDFRACRTEPQAEMILEAGQFVLFLPGEPHSPGNPAGAPSDCRKAVLKIRWNA